MLSLTDPHWRTLKGGYRTLYDASGALSRLEQGCDTWEELWNELHHQGDVDEASYAAVPHLVRICQDAHRRDWNLYGLVGLIEIERHRKFNPPIPAWLSADYFSAWGDLEKLALHDLAAAAQRELVLTALAVIAIARGQLRLGAFLSWLDESELAELTEDKLAWSKLYASSLEAPSMRLRLVAPRARRNCAPRRYGGPSVRPLNFAVRPQQECLPVSRRRLTKERPCLDR